MCRPRGYETTKQAVALDQDVCFVDAPYASLRPSAAGSCPTRVHPSVPACPTSLETPPLHITMLLLQSATLLGAFASAVSASRAVPLTDALQSDAAYKHLDLTHDLFEFHKNLTQIESISGNEKEVGEWLADSLTSQGYHVEKQVLSKDPLRFNVLAWPGSKREAEVLISSHIDTVSERLTTLTSLCPTCAIS